MEVVRSGIPESVHRGSVIALDAGGGTVMDLGTTGLPVLPRSSNKPLQAVGMVGAGLPFQGADLAVAAASHAGEPDHVERVRALLDRYGLTEADLACPADLPLSRIAADAMIAAGRGPAKVTMNCSGKHTAMLVTCTVNGWPREDYLDPAHPLQVAIRAAVERLAGEPVAAVGVDGCGAPVHAITLRGLARAFARLVTAPPGSAERQVADAMRAYPHVVSGTDREDTVFMSEVSGLLMKGGAEGVHAAALDSGAAVALKIDDGAMRARLPVLVAALRELGVSTPELAKRAESPVEGGGRQVGTVRLLAGLPR